MGLLHHLFLHKNKLTPDTDIKIENTIGCEDNELSKIKDTTKDFIDKIDGVKILEIYQLILYMVELLIRHKK